MPKVGIGQFHLSVATATVSAVCKQAAFQPDFPKMNFNPNMENINANYNNLFTSDANYQENSSSDENDSGSEHEDGLRQIRYEVGG